MARTAFVVLMAVLVLVATVSEARYLPTRADDSRLEEIRELLREILERTADGSSSSATNSRAGFGYDKRLIYKRSAGDLAQAAGAVPTTNGERMVPLFNLAQ